MSFHGLWSIFFLLFKPQVYDSSCGVTQPDCDLIKSQKNILMNAAFKIQGIFNIPYGAIYTTARGISIHQQ